MKDNDRKAFEEWFGSNRALIDMAPGDKECNHMLAEWAWQAALAWEREKNAAIFDPESIEIIYSDGSTKKFQRGEPATSGDLKPGCMVVGAERLAGI